MSEIVKIVTESVKTTRREKISDLGDVSKTGSECGSFFSIFEIVCTSLLDKTQTRFCPIFLYFF